MCRFWWQCWDKRTQRSLPSKNLISVISIKTQRKQPGASSTVRGSWVPLMLKPQLCIFFSCSRYNCSWESRGPYKPQVLPSLWGKKMNIFLLCPQTAWVFPTLWDITFALISSSLNLCQRIALISNCMLI